MWRGSETHWSHIKQREATRRCGEALKLTGRTWNKQEWPGGYDRLAFTGRIEVKSDTHLSYVIIQN